MLAPAAGQGVKAATALKQWEAENSVATTTDADFDVDIAKLKALEKDKPWKKEPKYFTNVRMSALAMIKILMHAKTGQGKAGIISSEKGNWVEVMGLVQGHYVKNTFVIVDSFALPVDANEVECSLNEASQIYMVNYTESYKQLGYKNLVVGWYHSHPGYKCFLSNTDITTQQANQLHQDPFVALVVDPVRSMATGKVEIKAFRTWPANHDTSGIQYPSDIVENMGAHYSKYYELPITVFRSTADAEQLNLLWNKYWMKTLSTSPLVGNRFFVDKQLDSVSQAVRRCEPDIGTSMRRTRRTGSASAASPKVETDSTEVATQKVRALGDEVLNGLLGMVVKDRVFNSTQ